MKQDEQQPKSTKLVVTIVVAVIFAISIGVTAWVIMIGLDGRPGSPATQRDVDRDAAEQRLDSASHE